jgi:hypothetical protein
MANYFERLQEARTTIAGPTWLISLNTPDGGREGVPYFTNDSEDAANLIAIRAFRLASAEEIAVLTQEPQAEQKEQPVPTKPKAATKG